MIGAVSRARRGRASTAVLIAVFGAVAVGITAMATLSDGDGNGGGDLAARRAALRSYADAIYPASRDAGRAIVQGIRPDIEQFRAGQISAEVWTADMAARAAEFRAARAAFAAVKPPDGLHDAAARFDEAFATYLAATSVLLEAGSAPTAERREALILEGAELGERGDRLFDRGAALLQQARRSAGLGPDRRFPDPDRTRGSG